MQFLLTSGLGAGPGKDGDGGKKVGDDDDDEAIRGTGRRGGTAGEVVSRGATKSNRATAMIYTQMLFAAGFDKWVFGRTMSGWSVVGCGLIVGSALWAVLGKETDVTKKEGVRDGHIQEEDADLEMVGGMRENRSRRESSEEEEGVPMLRGTEIEEGVASRDQRTDD